LNATDNRHAQRRDVLGPSEPTEGVEVEVCESGCLPPIAEVDSGGGM